MSRFSNLHSGNASLVKGATLEDHLLYKLSEDLSEEKEVSGIYPEVFLSMKETLENQYADLLNDSPVWSREAAYQQ